MIRMCPYISPPAKRPTPSSPPTFNCDGKLDLAVANARSGTLIILLQL